MAPALRSPSLGPPPRPRPPAEALRGVARSQRARGPGPPAMGSSSSRQPAKGAKGLLGRRTQSSGSLCTADKLGRLLAPCGRHRNHQEDHRHHRYKLCGSLPNHLDVAQEDGDNNNVISPASPAASEKGRVLEMQDLGYASERSPDEEKHFPGDISGTCECVPLTRTSRGLGLSVCGGADCSADGLVRIKRLFPHQPAWQSGRLRPGDVLLAVNGTPLSGLTNHDALEVLRTAPDHVVLTVARPSRPPSWVAPTPLNLCGVPPCQPRQPRREPAPSLQPPDPRTVLRQDSCGELELTLSKVQGSLGFTLRKEDSSALGHYVRALVREPALSDGRIRPGDKIVAVNGVDICHMSHEEAVMFLRQAGDSVVLRLYRDIAQTPVSALSPTETHKTFRPKPLRKEALDMLSDLAVRRMAPRPGESSTLGRPRKISDGRGGGGGGGGVGGGVSAASSASSQRARTRSFGEQQAHRSQELIASSRSSHGRGRGREESPLVDLVDSTVSSSSLSSLSSCANSVVERPRARRPDFLELSSGGKHPQPHPQPQPSSIHAPQWHLQRLTTSPGPGPDAAATWADDGRASDFASLPCDAGSPEHEGRRGTSSHFSHRNPAYQSAHPACRGGGPASGGGKRGDGGMAGDGAASGRQSVLDSRPGTRLPPQDSAQDTRAGDGCTGLLKWKGVVFTPEDDADTVSSTPPDQDTEDDTASQSTLEDNTGQVFTVELNRGWNSRLGFSLQNDGIHSVISAIYNDSVAAKNGRLRTGDRVIMVNDESVEGMETTDVIDLFRKIRGPIAITVWRQNDL